MTAMHCDSCGILTGYIYFPPKELGNFESYCIECGQSKLSLETSCQKHP
jgi:hypothetical protein